MLLSISILCLLPKIGCTAWEPADEAPPPPSLIQYTPAPPLIKRMQRKAHQHYPKPAINEHSSLDIAFKNLRRNLDWLISSALITRPKPKPQKIIIEPPAPRFEKVEFAKEELAEVRPDDLHLQSTDKQTTFKPTKYELRETWDFTEPYPRRFNKNDLTRALSNFFNFQKLRKKHAADSQATRVAMLETLPLKQDIKQVVAPQPKISKTPPMVYDDSIHPRPFTNVFAYENPKLHSDLMLPKKKPPVKVASASKNISSPKYIDTILSSAEKDTYNQYDLMLNIQAGAGFTANQATNNVTLDFVSQTDELKRKREDNRPVLALSALARFKWNPIQYLAFYDIGPKILYENFRIKGDVHEFGLIELNNFEYHLRSKNIAFLLESRLLAIKINRTVRPWAGFEFGANYARTFYKEHVKPGLIGFQRDVDIRNSGEVRLIYGGLAGILITMPKNIELDFHFEYLRFGQQDTGGNGNNANYTKGPRYKLNANNLMLGCIYHF